MKKSYLFDIGFQFEGTWKHPEDIPHHVLVKALEDRLEYVRNHPEESRDAFGFCDAYDIEYPAHLGDGV